MKVAVIICIFTIAILSAVAEESSNESLRARESRDAFLVQREISRKKNQNIEFASIFYLEFPRKKLASQMHTYYAVCKEVLKVFSYKTW